MCGKWKLHAPDTVADVEKQRVAAYAVVRDTAGAVLLTRNSPRSDFPGLWSLPGGGVDHGEHPAQAVLREVREETGLDVRLTGLPRVYADVVDVRGASLHTVRLVYDAEVSGGVLRPETGGTSDAAEYGTGDRPLLPFTAEALGVPVPPHPESVRGPREPVVRGQGTVRRQRLAAYGLAYHDDRVLVTQLSDRTPLPAAWTLPGGGVDHGEHPEVALVREFAEETGLAATVGGLAGVYSTHFTGQAPSGVLEDFHGIRLVYDVRVDGSLPPRVVDVGGTTSAVAWHPVERVRDLFATPLLTEVLTP
jgi:8-oxo-dGTP pyrophosphatase MutT (NUDIX family)